MQQIDFVIPWVDGNDSEWRKQKDYFAKDVMIGTEAARFRMNQLFMQEHC
jgi:hypothetical protein